MNGHVERWNDLSTYPPDASVLDPADRRGHKNRYICGLRDQAVVEALATADAGMPVLDFGCGTGGLTRALVASGRSVLGVDISPGLLHRTRERNLGDNALFVLYDGNHLPIADASMSSATTYVVLNHIVDDGDLLAVLREIRRVLRPDGRLVAVEQVRSRPTCDAEAWQHRRTEAGFRAIFERANFTVTATTVLRYGHLPYIYAVRLGLIPECAFPSLRRFERWVGRYFGILPWDYCDMRFEMTPR